MIITVTNMWPSDIDPNIGNFVQRVHLSIEGDTKLLKFNRKNNMLPNSISHLYYFIVQIQYYYKSSPTDIFIVHFISLSSLCISIARLCLCPRGIIIGFCHGSDLVSKSNYIFNLLINRISKTFLIIADSCICPSAYLKNILLINLKFKRNVLYLLQVVFRIICMEVQLY